MSGAVLEAEGLIRHYRLSGGRHLRAVDGVSLSVAAGETLALVGESGCGKSTLGRCLLRLTTLDHGRLRFEGREVAHLSERALRPLRPRMQMVFQDSSASLDPRQRVGDALAEPLRAHGRTRVEAAKRVSALLALVGLPEDVARRFPHEMSGGQRQRVNVARAVALEPRLVVADEPTSALDVSVQAQIVNLFLDLRDRLGTAWIFISHDLSVVRQISDRIAVMYLGQIVETGPSAALLEAPRHPYTRALLDALPRAEVGAPRVRALSGDVPSPIDPPAGCRFHPRCPRAAARCREQEPALEHGVACHFPLW